MIGADDFHLIALVGASGSGKSTLARRLLAEFTDIALSVSYTTRSPRPGELDGREYHFVDRARFQAMIAQQSFFEWAEVHGNLYGTSAEPVEAARRTRRGMLFDIDYQGARQIRARAGALIGVFILPPSFAELERRLRTRGTDDEDTIARRMLKAAHEIEYYALFDYLIVNDVLDRAYDELRSVIIAARATRARRAMLAETLLSPATPRAVR